MAEPNPFTPALSNHPFFNSNLVPAGNLESVCSDLWPLVLAHLPESRKRPLSEEYVFRSLLANFVMAMQTTEPELIVPRNKRFLPAKSRYRASQATYGAVTRALDAASEAGLIVQEIGSGQHKITCNYQDDYRCVREATRVRPGAYLIQHLTPLITLPIHDLTRWRRDTEVIHLRVKTQDKGKASSSDQVDYNETPETIAFRAQVRRINQHLQEHPCRYSGDELVNRMHDHVVRIFNNGDWQQGGRLYGYWPMNLPKGERQHLSIDGETQADLDFGSCFVALLHVHDGTEFDPDAPDPFTIDGYEQHRDVIKQCAYSILNTPKRMKNYPGDVIEDGSRPPMRWKEMEEAIFTHVPLFEKYRYTGLGLRLMRTESDILISLLMDLTERGIGFIPCHDGLMVPESKRKLTHDLMLKHYQAITGQRIKIKEKTIRKPPTVPFDTDVGQLCL